MNLSRLMAPATATAVLLTSAALVLAPPASAHGRHHRAPRLPAASTVTLTPAQQQVTITATGDSYYPTKATLDWTIPACTGTVYAYFQLNQGAPGKGPVYVQQKGATAYPCTTAAQTVTVTYSAADPSQGALTAGTVTLTTTTKPAATGSAVLKTTTTTLPAVTAASRLPDASTVVPTFAQGVFLRQDASSSTGVTSAARWIIPACTGTVRAAFSLYQDGENSPRALQQKGATDYPCSPADQSVTVTYWPIDPSAPAVHTGATVVRVDTYSAKPQTTTGTPLKSATYTVQAY